MENMNSNNPKIREYILYGNRGHQNNSSDCPQRAKKCASPSPTYQLPPRYITLQGIGISEGCSYPKSKTMQYSSSKSETVEPQQIFWQIVLPSVPNPLPNITSHIIQTKPIGFLQTHWMCLISSNSHSTKPPHLNHRRLNIRCFDSLELHTPTSL